MLRKNRITNALPAAKGRTFNVEQRWSLGRELGQGAYGVVVYVQVYALVPAT